jgi:hypothetical protein
VSLPKDAQDRKNMPIARGVLDYFPDAVAAVANVSFVANEQHNPGEPMHWAKEKSTDEADCIVRHLLERGTIDTDGLRHSAKVAWRALALLQRELDALTEDTGGEEPGVMRLGQPVYDQDVEKSLTNVMGDAVNEWKREWAAQLVVENEMAKPGNPQDTFCPPGAYC